MPKHSEFKPIPPEIKEWLKVVPVVPGENSGLVWTKAKTGIILGENAGYIKVSNTQQNRKDWKLYFNKQSYTVSRVIYYIEHSIDPKELTVDHIDRNTLNNNVKNLRLSKMRLQAANQNIRKDNTSGIRGISWSKITNKWEVYTHINGKKIYLGRFTCKKQAVLTHKRTTSLIYKELHEKEYINIESIQCECEYCKNKKTPANARVVSEPT